MGNLFGCDHSYKRYIEKLDKGFMLYIMCSKCNDIMAKNTISKTDFDDLKNINIELLEKIPIKS